MARHSLLVNTFGVPVAALQRRRQHVTRLRTTALLHVWQQGLEKYLMTKLYGKVFAASEMDRERDEALARRMEVREEQWVLVCC